MSESSRKHGFRVVAVPWAFEQCTAPSGGPAHSEAATHSRCQGGQQRASDAPPAPRRTAQPRSDNPARPARAEWFEPEHETSRSVLLYRFFFFPDLFFTPIPDGSLNTCSDEHAENYQVHCDAGRRRCPPLKVHCLVHNTVANVPRGHAARKCSARR